MNNYGGKGRYSGVWQREEPPGDQVGEKVAYDCQKHLGQRLRSQDDPSALHHHVQGAVLLSGQSQTRATSTHLCPPQEQPPAPSGKQTRHKHTQKLQSKCF